MYGRKTIQVFPGKGSDLRSGPAAILISCGDDGFGISGKNRIKNFLAIGSHGNSGFAHAGGYDSRREDFRRHPRRHLVQVGAGELGRFMLSSGTAYGCRQEQYTDKNGFFHFNLNFLFFVVFIA